MFKKLLVAGVAALALAVGVMGSHDAPPVQAFCQPQGFLRGHDDLTRLVGVHDTGTGYINLIRSTMTAKPVWTDANGFSFVGLQLQDTSGNSWIEVGYRHDNMGSPFPSVGIGNFFVEVMRNNSTHDVTHVYGGQPIAGQGHEFYLSYNVASKYFFVTVDGNYIYGGYIPLMTQPKTVALLDEIHQSSSQAYGAVNDASFEYQVLVARSGALEPFSQNGTASYALYSPADNYTFPYNDAQGGQIFGWFKWDFNNFAFWDKACSF